MIVYLEHIVRRRLTLDLLFIDIEETMNNPPKLLDLVRNKLRVLHYSYHTENSYVGWIKRYILFHNKQHPKDMGRKEIEAFLTYLAVGRNVAASTQNQAFSALQFLYEQILELDVFQNIDALRAKQPKRLPTVLSHDDAMDVIDGLKGVYKIIGKLLYGSGLRGIECLRLRIKDIDFFGEQGNIQSKKPDQHHQAHQHPYIPPFFCHTAS